MMDLTTKDRYLAMFPEDQKAWTASPTAFLSMRITSVSASVARYLDRHVTNEERIEKFTPEDGMGTLTVRVKGYPIEEVDSIEIFDTALSSDEFVFTDTGLIQFYDRITREELPYQDKISVKYTGGMADDTADFIAKYPDIEANVLMQIKFELERTKTISSKTVAAGATSSQMNPYGFMDELIRCLDRYKATYVK